MKGPVFNPVKGELLSVIKLLHAKKNSPIKAYHQLEEVYDEKCMDVKNVRKWCREFVSQMNPKNARRGAPSEARPMYQKMFTSFKEEREEFLNSTITGN